MPAESLPKILGLIAGNGALPLLLAQAATRAGHTVVAVGHRGETDPQLHQHVASLTWVRVGQVGAIVRAFRRSKVTHAAMAGGINKGRALMRFRPDWRGLQLLWRVAQRGDDALLRTVAMGFETWGIRIVSSTALLPHVLTPRGVLGGIAPSGRINRDLNDGLRLAHAIGTLDVGQTVALKDGTVLALEALEGTDACIARAGQLAHQRGVVVVKAAKPGQDMRFDVPTIGPQTVQVAQRAGVVAIGLEAGRTLLLDTEATLRLADAAGICVVGLGGMQQATRPVS